MEDEDKLLSQMDHVEFRRLLKSNKGRVQYEDSAIISLRDHLDSKSKLDHVVGGLSGFLWFCTPVAGLFFFKFPWWSVFPMGLVGFALFCGFAKLVADNPFGRVDELITAQAYRSAAFFYSLQQRTDVYMSINEREWPALLIKLRD